MTNVISLDQWARSLFKEISGPASLRRAQTSPEPGDGQRGAKPRSACAQMGATSSDVAPVVPGGKAIPHHGDVA